MRSFAWRASADATSIVESDFGQLAEEIRGKVAAWRDRRTVVLGDAIASLPPEDRRRLTRALPILARLADDLEAAGVAR